MSNVSLIDSHANSIIDIFNWVRKLGVYILLGYSEPNNSYRLELYKDTMYTSIYISEQELRCAQSSYICGLILNAVRDLNTAIESKEESE